MRILLLECESPASLQFLNFYKNEKDVKVVCGSSSRLPIILFSKFRRKVYRYPDTMYPLFLFKERIKKFNDRIFHLVRREKIDFIISQSEKTLIPLLLRPSLRNYLPYPTLKTIDILHDKKKLLDYLEEFSPKSFKLPTVYKSVKDVKYPSLIKPRKGAGGFLVKKVNNKEELLRVVKAFNKKKKKFILQELIPSKLKFTMNILIDKDGKIKRLLSFRKIKPSRLEAIKREIENFLREIGYFGFSSPQFLFYKNQFYLIEINPRLSYYYYGIDFGLNFPEAFHRSIIENENIEEKFKILTSLYPLTIASRIYIKESRDFTSVFMNYVFTTFYSLTKSLHNKYS